MSFQLPSLRMTIRAVTVLAMLAVGFAVLLAGGLPASAQGAKPQKVPDAPDKPTGQAIYAGMVDLEWNDLPDATSYEVKFYLKGVWNDLPGNGIDIAFYGAGAILRNLPEEGVYYFQVRARNALGPSDWSEYLFMEATIVHNWDDVPEPTNTAATGAPTISGKAEAGETLAASISDIEDENGLDRVKFSYQWTSGDGTADSDIEGATGATYTLQSDNAGKAIKVRVTFTDRGGYAESLTSSPVKVDGEAEAQPANTPATGAPTINGTTRVGETLTADTSGIADEDGLDNAVFSYQWIANDGTTDTDIQDTTGASYTLVAGDSGKTIKVRVSFTDDAGQDETLASAPTDLITARPTGICDRTPQVRDAILGKLPEASDCSEVTTEDLSGITGVLDLAQVGVPPYGIGSNLQSGAPNQHGDLITVQTGDFSGLSNLQRLHLSKNTTSTLPEGVFDELANLEFLDLEHNKLSELPEGVFDGLSNLKTLNLKGNTIGELPDGVFDGLSNLETLDLSWTGFTGLPADVFDELANLETLDLSRTGFTGLPAGVFDELAGLETLDLAHTELSELPDGVFDNLANLETLDLQFNNLGELPDGVFDNLANLETLELRFTKLTKLPEGVFDELANLVYLDLTGNNLIGGLPDGVFDNLANLKMLVIVSTRLSELPDDVFDGLTNLEDLTLTFGNLREWPDGVFDNLANLVYLSLKGNNKLPDGVFDNLANLETLDLSWTRFTALPADVFDHLANLEVLILEKNGLTGLPAGVFGNLANLATLDLRDNELSELPSGVLDGLHALRVLRLDDNNLTVLPDGVFHGLANLVKVSLQYNTERYFIFTAELEQHGDDALAVKVAQGAPHDMYVTLAAQGGTLSTKAVRIEGGSLKSLPITVSPNGQERTQVTVSVTGARFPWDLSWDGLQVGLGDPLTLSLTPRTGICDRTQQVQDAIIDKLGEGLDSPEVTDCAAVTDDHLSGITGTLDLVSTRTDALKPGDFGGLSSLETLDLRENDLTALPDSIFDELDGLEHLYLQNNDLSALPVGVFHELTGLKSLDFGQNDLTELRVDVFSGLSNLESLKFNYNKLTALPAEVFNGLSSLDKLELMLNDLSELPGGVFDGLSNLEDLKLGANDLTELPVGVFQGLSNLDYLSLSANELTELRADVFLGLSNLEELKLDSNDLSALPDGVFQGLSSLRSLNLNDNPGAPFTLTAELEQQVNDSFAIRVAEAAPFDTAVTLSAQGGTLSATSVTIEAGAVMSGLMTVTRTGETPATVSVASAGFQNYEEYDGIQVVPGGPLTLSLAPSAGICGRTPQVREAIIDKLGEGLGSPEVTDCAAVTEAHLSGITERLLLPTELAITGFKPGDFEGLTSLPQLWIDRHTLSGLPADLFAGLSSLRWLHLTGNGLTKLPAGIFCDLTDLDQIELQGNDLAGVTVQTW